MDWRNRDYYLIQLDYASYYDTIMLLKELDSTVKFSPPYNHFSNYRFGKYDGEKRFLTNVACPDFLLSCQKANSVIDYFLNEKKKQNKRFNFCKLSKNICGQ